MVKLDDDACYSVHTLDAGSLHKSLIPLNSLAESLGGFVKSRSNALEYVIVWTTNSYNDYSFSEV